MYVETFWLPVIGPSSTWVVRKLAASLTVTDGLMVCLPDLARAIGISPATGDNDPIVRTMFRLKRFKLIRQIGHSEWALRCILPDIPSGQRAYLTPALQALLASWIEPP